MIFRIEDFDFYKSLLFWRYSDTSCMNTDPVKVKVSVKENTVSPTERSSVIFKGRFHDKYQNKNFLLLHQ